MRLSDLSPSLIEGLISDLSSGSNMSSVLSSELNSIKQEISKQQKRDDGQQVDNSVLESYIKEFNDNSRTINDYFNDIKDAKLKTAIKTIVYKSGFVLPIGTISTDSPPRFKRIITNRIILIITKNIFGEYSDDLGNILASLANELDKLFKSTSYNNLSGSVSTCFSIISKMSKVSSGHPSGLQTERFTYFLDAHIINEQLNENFLSVLFNGGIDYTKAIAVEISNAAKAIKLQMARSKTDNTKNAINDSELNEYNLELKKLNNIYNSIKYDNVKHAFAAMCIKGGYKLPVAGISISREKPPAYNNRIVLKIIMFVSGLIMKLQNLTPSDVLEDLIVQFISAMTGIGIILDLILNAKTYQEVFMDIKNAYGKVIKLSNAYIAYERKNLQV